MKKANESQSIDTIIHSFEGYALGDIKYNKTKPIAAFILGILFIDQIASFRYSRGTKSENRVRKFISRYMNEYEPLNLYENTRDSLAHNYSSKRRFGLTNDERVTFAWHKQREHFTINTDIFIRSLEKALHEVSKDFREIGSEAHTNATNRSIVCPVMVYKDI